MRSNASTGSARRSLSQDETRGQAPTQRGQARSGLHLPEKDRDETVEISEIVHSGCAALVSASHAGRRCYLLPEREDKKTYTS